MNVFIYFYFKKWNNFNQKIFINFDLINYNFKLNNLYDFINGKGKIVFAPLKK